VREKFLSIFISALFLFNLFFPVDAFALHDPRVYRVHDLNAEEYCEGEKSRVTFTWSYDADWDDLADNDYRIELQNMDGGDVKNTQHPYDIEVNENEGEQRWLIKRCDQDLFQPRDCDPSDWSTYTPIKCSPDDPDEPEDPSTCTLKVTTPGGEDLEENPEFISLEIDTRGKINTTPGNPAYHNKYNVQITGAGGFVRGATSGDKFEFKNYPDESPYYGGRRQFIDSDGVITIPSLSDRGRVTEEVNSTWKNREYEVVVLKHDTGAIFTNEISSCSFRIGSESDEDKFVAEPLSRPCGDGAWTAKEGCTQIKTALGPVPTDPNIVVRWILGFILGISGGILLIILIINGFKLMVSQGDPEKIQDARNAIISAIAGLLLIIFSLMLIRLITVDVLGLPGFG